MDERGNYLFAEKIDTTGSIERKKGSGRPRSARTVENKEEVEEEIYSQENPDNGEIIRHESPRMIAQRLGISNTSVYQFIGSTKPI